MAERRFGSAQCSHGWSHGVLLVLVENNVPSTSGTTKRHRQTQQVGLLKSLLRYGKVASLQLALLELELIISRVRICIHFSRELEKTVLTRDGCCAGKHYPVQADLAPSRLTYQTVSRNITVYSYNAIHGTFHANLASQVIQGARDNFHKQPNDRGRREKPSRNTACYCPPTDRGTAGSLPVLDPWVGSRWTYPACGIKSAKGVLAKEHNDSVKQLFEDFFSFSACERRATATEPNTSLSAIKMVPFTDEASSISMDAIKERNSSPSASWYGKVLLSRGGMMPWEARPRVELCGMWCLVMKGYGFADKRETSLPSVGTLVKGSSFWWTQYVKYIKDVPVTSSLQVISVVGNGCQRVGFTG
ncbi:hypothetical protein J3R82DRAFT_5137 [Butyriboletus roseoflavus]|nr:hypothetical protein J3R82DRAFT_5137 [Butyriboletus roseoflavus]